MTEFSAIVFTDLDGTLLDHHSYDFRPALPALKQLADMNIPVILASSKTAAEIAPLRKNLSLSEYPAIVENGAGVLPAGQHARTDDSDYWRIRMALSQMPPPLRQHFTGFGDMSARQVADHTGLSLTQAQQAKTRLYSEPGIWSGDDAALQAFVAALKAQNISHRYGGRYLTLSYGSTKADRMAEITAHFKADRIIALGDAPNDLEMLLAADHPILIRNPEAKPLTGLTPAQSEMIIRSTLPGPAGWNETILELLATLTNTHKKEPDQIG